MASGGDPLVMDVGPTADAAVDGPFGEPGRRRGGNGLATWLAVAIVVAALGMVAVTALGSADRVIRIASGWRIEQPPAVPTSPPTTRWALELEPDQRLDDVKVVDDHVVAVVTETTEDLAGNTTRVIALDQAEGDRVWTHELRWDVPPAIRDQGGSPSQYGPPMVHAVARDEVVTLARFDSAPGWLPELALDAATGSPLWERPPAAATSPRLAYRRAHPGQRRSVTTSFGDATPGPSEVVDLDTGRTVFRSRGQVAHLSGDRWLSQALRAGRVTVTLLAGDGSSRTRLSASDDLGAVTVVTGPDTDGEFLLVATRDELRARTFDDRSLWSLALDEVGATGTRPIVWQLGDGRALVAMVQWRSEPEIRHVAMVDREGATAMADSGLVDVPGVVEHGAVLGTGEPLLLCSTRSRNETGCPAELALLGIDGRVRATSDEPSEGFLGDGRTVGHATQAGPLRVEGAGGRALVLRDWQALDVTWRLDVSTLGWTPDLMVSTSERGIALGSSRPGTEAGPVIAWAS